MAGIFHKLVDGLDYLDGRVKQTIEGEVQDQDIESIIDQRMKRKQRVDAAKDNAPFGSALSQPPLVSPGAADHPDTSSPVDGPSDQGVGSAFTTGGSGTKPVRPVLGARLISTRSPRAPTPEVAGRPSPSPATLDVSPLAAASSSIPSFKATQNESEPAAIDTGDHFRMPERPAEPARTGFISLGTRSSRSPSNDREADELRALIKQLQKEVKELNEENVDFEQRILGQEKELKAAAEALEYATAKAAARESELLDEIREIKQAKDVDRRQFNAAMGAKDKQVSELESQLVGAKAEAESYSQQAGSLRREMASLVSDKEGLTQQLDVAMANQERGVEGLRAELLQSQMTIDDMKAQHTAWVRQAQRREQELEATTAELTESMAAKQREIETLKASFHQMGDSSHSTDLEMHRLQQELRATQGSLELERQHVVSLQREVRALQMESSSVQAAYKEEREANELKLHKALARSAELERQLVEAQKSARESRGPLREEMDSRMKSVSEQLVKKQEQLDSSICENYALGARLKSAEQRVRALEDQLVEARSAAGNGGEGLFDLEGAGDIDSMGMRNRGSRAGKRPPPVLRSISRLEPIAANPSLAKVVDSVDRFSVSVGHYLRAYPVARLCFIVYFVLLHLWAFCVLIFHTERLEEIHGDVGGSFIAGGKGSPAGTGISSGGT